MSPSIPGTGKKVAVIGAGASGLTALKSLKEAGHDVTAFEKSAAIGGIYNYKKDSASVGVYASTLFTSSAFLTSYSDFPPGPKPPGHYHHEEFYKYLTNYAEHFKLNPFIKFSHTIKNLTKLPDGKWQLTSFDQINNTEEQTIFDAVAVCSGVHQFSMIPDLKGLKNFKGEIMHAGYYRTPDTFKDKNVIILGGGESGSDIVEEISGVTRTCFLSLRRGTLVIPRLIFKRPNDFFTNRLFYTLPPWILRQRNKGSVWAKLFIFLLAIMTFKLLLMALMKPIYALAETSRAMDLFLGISINVITLYLLWLIIEYFFIYLGIKELGLISKLSLQSLAGHGEQFATKCQGIVKALANKKCELKPDVEEFTPDGVKFKDQSFCKADTIIFCTGYETRFPFLGINKLDSRTLYKNCFDPKLGSTLCFIGFARPAIGSIPPIAEMQSRWFGEILNGNITLPADDVIRAEIEKDAQEHKKCFAVNSERITGLVDFTSYMDELAGYVGCRPLWKDLCKDPFLLFRVYFNPFLACQYRLRGPNEKMDLAKKTMAAVPINFFQFIYGCFFVCLIVWCSLLNRLGLKVFKPQLPL